MTQIFDDKDIAAALERIALTPDGEILYDALHKEAADLLDVDPSDGALRSHHGRRTFARELMKMMAKGIEEGGRRPDGTSGKRSDRIIVYRAPQPVVVGARLTPRELAARSLTADAGG